MRTQTTKQAELQAFEKLSSISIIIGAVKVLYKRHEMPIVYLLAIAGWAFGFYGAFN